MYSKHYVSDFFVGSTTSEYQIYIHFKEISVLSISNYNSIGVKERF